MAYFRNRTVNLLNLHYAIHAVALSGGAAFFTVYLLKAGVGVEATLIAIAAILIGRLLLRPMVVPLGARFGIRPLLVAGTFMTAMQYPLLAEVHGVGPMLFALCAMSSAGDTLYWSTYHAYFAALGDDEHRGHQIGAREAVAALVGIMSPLVTAFLLTRLGPRAAFGATALVVASAAIPLFFTPDVKVAARSPGAYKASMQGVLLFVADGWIAAGFYFAWQIVLFQTLHEDFENFGGALAIAALAGAIGGLLLGRHIDEGHGRRAALIACGAVAFVVILRALVPGAPLLAVAATALGSLTACLYLPTLMTAVYTLAKRAPCILRFHVAAEGGWDVGGASALLSAAALVHFGAPLSFGVLIGLIGTAGAYWQLRRYYVLR